MPIPCTDPALVVVQEVTAALRGVFDPESNCPPDGGGTSDIRFLATDAQGIPPGLLPQCGTGPLVWVRLHLRYRARRAAINSAVVSNEPCQVTDIVPAIALEIGVARCSSLEAEYIDWDAITTEELVALDDSFRIESALRMARCRLQSRTRAVASDTVAPLGPDGGQRGVTGMLYVQLEGR